MRACYLTTQYTERTRYLRELAAYTELCTAYTREVIDRVLHVDAAYTDLDTPPALPAYGEEQLRFSISGLRKEYRTTLQEGKRWVRFAASLERQVGDPAHLAVRFSWAFSVDGAEFLVHQCTLTCGTTDWPAQVRATLRQEFEKYFAVQPEHPVIYASLLFANPTWPQLPHLHPAEFVEPQP